MRRICETVQRIQIDYEISINHQRINNSRSMNRRALKDLIGLITHHAIDLIFRELNVAELLTENFNQ